MKFLLTVFFFSIFLICFSQRNSDSLYFVNLRVKAISFSDEHHIYANIPFKNVEVIDARFDSSNIGFIGFSNPEKPLKIIFKDGLSYQLYNFIKNNYKLNNIDSAKDLLILIKEFRITDYTTNSGIKNNSELKWNSGAIISAELFLSNNGSYHALYKVDTTVTADSESELIVDLIKGAFQTIFKRVENKNISEIHIGKNAFAYADIKKHIEDFSNIPILKDSILKRGVYKNFNEFKLNSPSIKNYEVHKGKLSDELFVTENNQYYPLQNFWGYCDGKNLFIYSVNNLFQLIRFDNAFNTKALNRIQKTHIFEENPGIDLIAGSIFLEPEYRNIPMHGNNIKGRTYTPEPTAFQLNMQTGELY